MTAPHPTTDRPPIELRAYQLDALQRTEAAEAQGVRSQLGVAATGLGKTIIFASLLQRRGGRGLVLVHRDELASQAIAKIREVWPGVDVGLVKASSNDVRAHVVVASVQTLARSKRMRQLIEPFSGDTLLGRAEPFETVIVDEAHHATADTYRGILKALRAGEGERDATPEEVDAGCELGIIPQGPLLLGVTATPDRGDGQGLADLFERVVWNYDILWGIGEGYLADLRGQRVELALDTSKLKVSRGDYAAGDAGRALAKAGAPRVVVDAWQRHAEGRRTLAFTPTVLLAQQITQAFLTAGVDAEFLSGETDVDERRAILRRYASGETTVLSNCAVLTEGFDEPRTDCILIARPTKSRALYAQMVGRGTRRHPDKTDCLVLDVVGATRDHTLLTIPTLFGVDAKDLERGTGTVSSVVHAHVDEMRVLGTLTAEEAEMFSTVRANAIAWVAVHNTAEPRRYECRLGRGAESSTMVLAESRPGTLYAGDWVAAVSRPDGVTTVIMSDPSMELTQGVAEDYVRRYGTKSITKADAYWRTQPPSDKLRNAAAKWRITVDPTWTAGQMSDAISAKAARSKARRRHK